jgi:hypothetical protein
MFFHEKTIHANCSLRTSCGRGWDLFLLLARNQSEQNKNEEKLP